MRVIELTCTAHQLQARLRPDQRHVRSRLLLPRSLCSVVMGYVTFGLVTLTFVTVTVRSRRLPTSLTSQAIAVYILLYLDQEVLSELTNDMGGRAYRGEFSGCFWGSGRLVPPTALHLLAHRSDDAQLARTRSLCSSSARLPSTAPTRRSPATVARSPTPARRRRGRTAAPRSGRRRARSPPRWPTTGRRR